jgi:hypothetical protein
MFGLLERVCELKEADRWLLEGGKDAYPCTGVYRLYSCGGEENVDDADRSRLPICGVENGSINGGGCECGVCKPWCAGAENAN